MPLGTEADGSVRVERTRRAALWVDVRWRARFEQSKWRSGKAVLDHFTRGHPPPWPRMLIVPPDPGPGGGDGPRFFFKLYNHPEWDWRPWHKYSRWRYWWRESKASREFRNYGNLERLGIPCAQRVAWGERRDLLGRLRWAFILTEAIPEVVTLPEFFQIQARHPDAGLRRSRRIRVIRQLADMTRRIHAAGFFHNDLYGRNVLVRLLPAGGDPEVYWIDCPKGGYNARESRHRRLRIKDLASLDLTAMAVATRPERLRFLLEYCGERRLTPSVRHLILDVVRYRQSRWPVG
ncbi:MAG TPA: lipopolysaccharide kinase InaA family protein [Verrucomicrobiota bacterium]|nr:lipopolysaccharide kinase InaA family protein [Verrucomicrobiota bacterium]HNU50696.1 lipopolysaccharide kinase InaA family protein [Verrucomicrobiota bacterium]